ncbi:TRAP transporter small permease [Paraburkholderia dipogonis]|uniref:TRAP transporter small permease n=1 Tax=Paraburkholderia dipogonis TaxID=1211383 RepID=UPI0035E60F61
MLLAGVTSRYILHAPLVWSDELASMLFLWLAMLGAVIALRRGEHMRMTARSSAWRHPACARFSTSWRSPRRSRFSRW